MVTKKKVATAKEWEVVQEFSRSKDPSSVWIVSRRVGIPMLPTNEYKCSCPAYIFRWPNEHKKVAKAHLPNGEPTCKHILWVIEHQADLVQPDVPEPIPDAFAPGVREAFMRRVWQRVRPHRQFDPKRAVLSYALDHAEALSAKDEEGWAAFVSDVRLLATAMMPKAAQPVSIPGGKLVLGKRRILLEGD